MDEQYMYEQCRSSLIKEWNADTLKNFEYQNIMLRDQRWHKQMERYTMFLHYRNQYCENDSTTKTIYGFNEIPIKLPMAFFTELEQKILQLFYRNTRDPK